MPKVSIIDYTGKGSRDQSWHAARLLAFTKNTRLQMNPDGFKEFEDMPVQRIAEEIAYMATTIPSSWEFVDVTFLMTDLSRATAQQVTRTRTASFAMQSQRVTDMSGVTWDNPYDENSEDQMERERFWEFERGMNQGLGYYGSMIHEHEATMEDARDLLPIGVHCNLVAKYSLRTIAELVQKRKSIRVQGPYRDIVVQMEILVKEIWPWSEAFFKPKNEVALQMLETVAKELAEAGAVYKGPAGQIAKAIDLLK
jgi:thymidylate synthase ThyX